MILCWLFLILSDYVENCLNLCPSSARRGTVFGRLRAAAYDYLRLARNRLYRYHFDGNYSIFPYGLIEFLEYFFFELNGCRNNIFIILRYVDGGIPLRHPSCKVYILWWVPCFKFAEAKNHLWLQSSSPQVTYGIHRGIWNVYLQRLRHEHRAIKLVKRCAITHTTPLWQARCAMSPHRSVLASICEVQCQTQRRDQLLGLGRRPPQRVARQ